MHDDAGRGALRGARVAAVLLVAAAPARAQAVRGYLQGQFQQVEQVVPFENPDGTTGTRRSTLRRWIQIVDVSHQAQLRSNLLLSSSFRLTDLRYDDLPDASRTPQGTLQLSHPWVRLFATHRPARVTGGLGRAGPSAPGGAGREIVYTARTQETSFSGQLTPPGLPRLDLSWTRRHRDRDAVSAEETGWNRDARLTWAVGPLETYASLGDLRTGRPDAGGIERLQRTGTAGAVLHLAPVEGGALDLQYGLTDTRGRRGASAAGSARTHSAGASGSLRASPTASWSGGWQFRRAEIGGTRPQALDDHEGTLHWSWDPLGPLRAMAGLGARTVRSGAESGLLSYANAVLALEGRLRPGWSGVASLSHVSNRDPVRGNYPIESARLGSSMRLLRGLEATTHLQVTANGDTAARPTRLVSEANARVRATPLRSLVLGFEGRVYRAGPALADPATRSRTVALDLRWKPVPSLELIGSRGTSVAGTGPGGRLGTRSAGARWSPGGRLQLSADWSRSDQSRSDASIQQISGREILSGRAVAIVGRSLQLAAGAAIGDRRSERENRQADVTLTWSFGR